MVIRTRDDASSGLVAGVNVPHINDIYVGGDWQPPADGSRVPVISPATEEVVALVGRPGRADATAAAEAAAQAFRGPWPDLPLTERIETCLRFCEGLEARFDDVGHVWAAESGMPLSWSGRLHRHGATVAWRGALDDAQRSLADEPRVVGASDVLIVREPVGPVLAILPYNGPLPTIGLKVVPALLAGCPVVVKAAPESALTARLIAEVADESGFPRGVLSVLAGDLEVSQHLVERPEIALISLTGGGAAATDILRRSADRLPRTVFELGGKSPAIVLDDADLDTILTPLVAGAMSGAGQVCTTLSRIFVPRHLHDAVVDALRDAYNGMRVGDPLDPRTDHGPLIDRRAWQRADRLVQAASVDGARIVTGGGRPAGLERGFYYAPTLIADAPPCADVLHQEVFGPVTCVVRYDDLEQAIGTANDSPLGLAASVFSADVGRAMSVARRLDAGSVAINTVGPSLAAPYGGVKASGWGREGGPEGIQEFTNVKQILQRRSRTRTRPAPRPEQHERK
jgi:acyl-CoA reductase-like NAD-dependent aldehyde dehydrogenase